MLVRSLMSFFSRILSVTRAAECFLAKSEWMRKVPSKTEGMHSVCLCNCKAAVELVLVALAHHHLATGNDARAFSHLLERAAAYLHVSSKYLAFLNLNKAEVLRNSGAKKGNVLGYFEEATFLSLKGEGGSISPLKSAGALLSRRKPIALSSRRAACCLDCICPWLFACRRSFLSVL
ncbi:adenylate cyclase type 10-like [Struthio camelus]|uniref:adenylate cyclase type 10-like n=1 Tax=Struthio camelus TaxID=8801 RepID=UPI003603B149